jgi:hypothetical protein
MDARPRRNPLGTDEYRAKLRRKPPFSPADTREVDAPNLSYVTAQMPTHPTCSQRFNSPLFLRAGSLTTSHPHALAAHFSSSSPVQ